MVGESVLGFLLGTMIAWWQQDITVIGLILLSCALGYSYQGPPFRLGYQGLGRLLLYLLWPPQQQHTIVKPKPGRRRIWQLCDCRNCKRVTLIVLLLSPG